MLILQNAVNDEDVVLVASVSLKKFNFFNESSARVWVYFRENPCTYELKNYCKWMKDNMLSVFKQTLFMEKPTVFD